MASLRTISLFVSGVCRRTHRFFMATGRDRRNEFPRSNSSWEISPNGGAWQVSPTEPSSIPDFGRDLGEFPVASSNASVFFAKDRSVKFRLSGKGDL